MAEDRIKPFTLDFDLVSGLCKSGRAKLTHRFVSNMAAQFNDSAAAEEIVRNGDKPIYDFYELDQIPETAGDLKFGTSIVYAGKVGDEYFMTQGHFHTILETGEVYYCLAGQGAMLMETPEGEVHLAEMKAGEAVYVPPRWAHRSINTGNETMVTFFVFRSDAGHDYGTIKQKGYRKLVVERDGKPVMIDNPKWAE
ncbi:glucose-6-phosphate isomerase family protein [Butyricicoccus sp.]|uniref:glucose-6-phosphate isomerase family protein n=1 Tax=Butyricicoccus sp. TaxID=2049021 RepID=UPI003AB0E94A